MKVTIVGGGKVGYYLVKTLIEHGHEPKIIELDKKTCSFIANDLDIPVICGDGTSIEVLQQANLSDSDAIICVSGQDENNLIACQLAKKIFNVKKSIARVNNPKNAEALKMLGVDIVISSTDRIVAMLEREVDSSKIKELISLNHGAGAISELQLPENYALNGVKLMDLNLPENMNIISITRNEKLIIPRGQTELESSDKLLVISNNISITKLYSLLKLGL